MTDLDHLTALHAAATPGEWYVGVGLGIDVYSQNEHGRPGIGRQYMPADAALIVAMHAALPGLVGRLRALEHLADERDKHHAAYCCTVDCPDGGRHNDPTDPIRIEELVGIFGDSPPPLREHRTIPCPGTCTCPTGSDVAEPRAVLNTEDTP